jgi:hypothetical protein
VNDVVVTNDMVCCICIKNLYGAFQEYVPQAHTHYLHLTKIRFDPNTSLVLILATSTISI